MAQRARRRPSCGVPALITARAAIPGGAERATSSVCHVDQQWQRGPHHQRGVTAHGLPTPVGSCVSPAAAAVRRLGGAIPSAAVSSSCSAAVSEGSCDLLKNAESPGFGRLVLFPP